MELFTYCYKCSFEFSQKQRAISEATGKPVSSLIPHDCRVYFMVGDQNVYKLKCNRGHEFYYIYPEQKFEILFKSAINAYSNKFLRDAVSSAAVSLERFYEFCVKAMCLSNGISIELFTDSWKEVSNQSERQLGAFIYLYLVTTKQKAPLLNNDLIKLRNGVVHKGLFPNEVDTFKYMNGVLNNMYTVLNELNKYIHSTFENLHKQLSNELLNEYSKKEIFATSVLSSGILGTVAIGYRAETLEEKIGIAEKVKDSERALIESAIEREINRSNNKPQPRDPGNALMIRAKADNSAQLKLYVSTIDDLFGPIGVYYFSEFDVSMGFGTAVYVPDETFTKLAKSLFVECSYITRTFN